ncbi:MAG TPA: rhodanese-like domain-containing protein [Spirochaetota bacterium]|nr:rhodanese-like domain-containing protein [Spirochaetota bacterium]HPC40864.1 rhodanese-like domain-containing protein [Spirochaetota bacterium]HQF07746.1 rhodanese-like domain-containing protein [Spirochaetota bacterium]HQH96799.1 rhodanese-like domain-containing protein [Spirochaetota bacterium]HQJ70694.1 rhodanese-like domain-containing protein [Spirochaetota bacterium]
MKIKIYAFASIIGAALLAGGTGNAASGILQVGPDEAAELMRANAGNKNFVILDIRTPGEYRDGHVPNSVLLDFYSPSFRDSLAALDKNRTYLIYCRSANRTGRAIGIMKELGFTKIVELRGGIKSWLSSGRTLQVQ